MPTANKLADILELPSNPTDLAVLYAMSIPTLGIAYAAHVINRKNMKATKGTLNAAQIVEE